MPTRSRAHERYELVRRSSEDSRIHDELENNHFSYAFQEIPSQSWLPTWLTGRLYSSPVSRDGTGHRKPSRRFRRLPFLLRVLFRYLPITLLILICLAYFVFPSYTNPPGHYQELRKRCEESELPGRGNIKNEKIFIASSIYDHRGDLLNGAWGRAMLQLVDILGPKNVHLSIYENDADEQATAALETFKNKVESEHTILTEHLALAEIHNVTLPSGEQRVKRIAFLAEARNRALRPLSEQVIKYDKVLFVNDVMFDPIDIAQLLFSTAQDPNSQRTTYGAACAVDFINPFKFYDRFATRDLDGYSMGVPFYPWFTSAGTSTSRRDTLVQSDAVPVRSCWGGITAFEAHWFQPQSLQEGGFYPPPSSSSALLFPPSDILPLRFRFEQDPFWDSSECCLIHADLTYARHGLNLSSPTLPGMRIDSGIVMNPYVRVAYDSFTLGWLPYTRRPERLYAWVHRIVNRVAGMPYPNPHMAEQPGDLVKENGVEGVEHPMAPGRFCGGRKLLVMKENPSEGEKNWERLAIPNDEAW